MLLAARHQAVLFAVAVQFLTRLPVPPLSAPQAQWLPQSARYFPLVGVLVGVANVAIWCLANRVLPNEVSVGVMLASSLLLTGALHEDGFADACDGFGGGTTKERVLDIMKDSRIGTYGAAALVVMLGLKWATLGAMPGAALPLMVVGAHAVSRWFAIALIWCLPYVRTGEDAKARPFAGNSSAAGWFASGVIGAAAAAPVFLGGPIPHGSAGPALLVAVTAASITAVVAGAYCRWRIGGYTGDCLGAVQQLTELAFLLGGLAVLAPPSVA